MGSFLLRCSARMVSIALLLALTASYQAAEGQFLIVKKLITEESVYPIQSNSKGWLLLSRAIFQDTNKSNDGHLTLYRHESVVAEISQTLVKEREVLSLGEDGEIFLLNHRRSGQQFQFEIEMLAAPYTRTKMLYKMEISSASQVLISGNLKGQFAAIIDNHINHPGGVVSAVLMGGGTVTSIPLLSESSRLTRKVSHPVIDDDGSVLVGISQYYREYDQPFPKVAPSLVFSGSITHHTFSAATSKRSTETLRPGTSIQELSGGIALVSRFEGGSDALRYVSSKTLKPISHVKYALAPLEASTGFTTWTGSMSVSGEFPIVEDRIIENTDVNAFLLLSPTSGVTKYSCPSFNHTNFAIARMGAIGEGKFYVLLDNSKDQKNVLYVLTRSVSRSEGDEVCRVLDEKSVELKGERDTITEETSGFRTSG